MDISKLDKNFAQQTGNIDDNIKAFTLPCDEIDLYGVDYDDTINCFQRMPYPIAKSISYPVEVISSTTAGGRARFKTNSKNFVLHVKYRYLLPMNTMPFSSSAGFTLLKKTAKGYDFVAGLKPTVKDEKEFTAKTNKLDGELNEYILYFPLYNDYITEITLGFDADAIVERGGKYAYPLPIVYYGSSITQGGCCSRPDNCYQALISKWRDLDYINLGFSGNAKGEPEMAEYISKIPAQIFVCDYDSNAPTVKHLKDTYYNFYKIYRDKNANTPIIFISRPHIDADIKDGLKRIKVIKDAYKKAKENGDNDVYFLDGRKLFGKDDRENCTVDGCHPNDLGFYRMAKAIDKIIAEILKK